MRHLISTQSLAAAAVALVAFAAASSAHARSDVQFSIGVQVPGAYVYSGPVYGPPPTYYVPAPTYYVPAAPNYYVPAPNYYRHHGEGRHHGTPHWQNRGPYGDRDRDGFANIYDQRGSRHHWRQPHPYGPYGDLDRDGVVNQRDRDRDGDGIRNRFDRLPNNPYRN